MTLTANKARIIIRWIHFISGLVIMCYIYSPFHENKIFQIAMKFVIIPITAFTGVWIWKFSIFNKFFKIHN